MSEPTSADLGVKLDDLWGDETCAWHIDFGDEEWAVVLEWTQEGRNEHNAEWVTFVWQFYGVTVEAALTEAITWCEALLPFERCSACDGEGSYGPVAVPKVCEDCGGTGLAR